MERIFAKTFLLGILSLAFFSCDHEGPTVDSPSEKLPGNWGVCFDSSRCESVFDDGYMISDNFFSRVELSGYENTEYQSSECEKCAKTSLATWTYEIISKDAYTLQGDSISFSTDDGGEVSIKLSNPGRIVKARIHYKREDRDTVLTEYWTRLSGTFTLLN